MTDIVCLAGVDLLMDYLEGVLTDDVRAALDAHVAECQRCAAFVDSYCATPGLFKHATDASLPDDIQRALRAFLRARRR
jgi:anti-sigma factor RsiW